MNRRRDVHWYVLAHHRVDQGERCVWVPLGQARRVAVCARCLALYPALFATLSAQLALGPRSIGPLDWWIGLLGAAPALVDWGLGRLGHRGSNVVRLATGALLGVALGRTLSLQMVDPANEVFWVQALLLVIGVLAFEVVARLGLGDEPR